MKRNKVNIQGVNFEIKCPNCQQAYPMTREYLFRLSERFNVKHTIDCRVCGESITIRWYGRGPAEALSEVPRYKDYITVE